MNPEAIAVVIQLLAQITSTVNALTAVSDLIKVAKEEGRDITLDELKELQMTDNRARDALEKALNEALE